MPKNSFIFNFKRPLRVFARMVLFVLFLEGFLNLGGWVFIFAQECRNQAYAVKGSYRILCLGDSITANGGDYSYPSQLQYALNHDGRNLKFQVINKGMPSWTTTDMSDHFEEYLQKYHPQMIVFMVGVNDISFYNSAPIVQTMKIKLVFLRKIKTYRLLRKLWKEKHGFETGLDNKTGGEDEALVKDAEIGPIPLGNNLITQEDNVSGHTAHAILPKYYLDIVRYHPLTIHNYNDMIELSLKKGIKIVVMQYPMVNIVPLRNIIDLKNKVLFVDNETIFKEAVQRQGVRQYFEDDYGHLTHEGSALLVNNLSPKILILTQ